VDRPQVGRAAAEALKAVAVCLSAELGCEVQLEGHLAEASVSPFGRLARFSVFALLELAPLGAVAVLEIDLPTLGAILNRVAGAEGRPGLPLSLTRIEEAALGWVMLLALEVVRQNQSTRRRFGPRLLSLSSDRGEVL